MMGDAENNNSTSTARRALRALQELQAKLASLEEAQREPIAIVGMGCRLPGARNVADFWEMLREGRNGITEVPADRWDVDAFFTVDPRARGKIASRWGGFVDGLDRFDAQFFGISPREAPHVDPRQRLMLEVTWEALEDAGIPPSSLAGTQTGVFVAALSNDYDFIICRDYKRLTSFTGAGTANSIVANRVSYFLDLRGPSIALDTACSGSLLTIELACRSLRTGESSLAIAGGVSVNLLPRGDIFFSQAGALSPDGRCQAFDSRANGIVRSEGAGVVVLKPLSRALADHDRIYALVRGGATNHDGRSNGIMAPSGLAQEAMLREAYRLAGVSPASVQFVETHGTGTPLGDPIEVKALGNVLGEGRPADRPCVLGSVKTNLGHLESTAGVAGVIKTALALHHRQIPANLHFVELNPLITRPDFPLTVQTELTAWPSEDEPLIAGVSGFSFGGTNVHLVLEEAPARTSIALKEGRKEKDDLYVLPLSGRSPAALHGLGQEYLRFLEAPDSADRVIDICYTAGARRSHHDYRLAVIGRSTREMSGRLSAWLNPTSDGEVAEGDVDGHVIEGRGGREGGVRLVFVFSGQGSHAAGMGLELFERESVFRDALNELDVLFSRHVSWSLTSELFESSDRSRLNETDIGQPAIFAVQMALFALWRSWGVIPAAVVGQSLGEVAAACASGALSLEDAVSVVFHRSRLMKATAGNGLTAVVGLPPAETDVELARFNGSLCVAGSSGPTSSVVSGAPRAVRMLVERLGSRNVFCRVIDNVDVAFHSPQMEPLSADLETALQGICPQSSGIPFYSTVTGGRLEGSELGARYWSRNLREPFRFSEVVGQLIGLGYDSFLEISPHAVLSGAVRQSLMHAGSDGAAIPSLVRGDGEGACLRQALSRLYVEGYDADWRRLYDESARLTGVPGYVWQRERYWHDQIEGGGGRRDSSLSRMVGDHPFVSASLRSSLGSGQFFWETEVGVDDLRYLKDHRIQGALVIPGAAYLEMALSAVAQLFPGAGATIEEVDFDRAMIIAEDDVRTVQLVLNPSKAGEVSFKVFSAPIGQGVSGSEKSVWTEHAAMRVLVDQSGDGGDGGDGSRHVPLAELKARFTEELDADEHYREMESRQFTFGPSFRAIRRLWRHGDEALSLVELPASLTSDSASYQVHPVLIDAGFQTIAATLSRAGGETFLPRSVKHLRAFTRSASSLWCHVRIEPSTGHDETLVAEIDLIDEAGNVVVEIQGLTLKRLDSSSNEADVRDSLYEINWRLHPAQESSSSRASGQWLILGDRGGLGEAIAARLAETGDASLVLHSDARAELEAVVGGQGAGASDQRATVDGQPPLLGVINLWGLDIAPFEGDGLAGLDLAQELGPLSGLAVIRGLSRQESHAATKVWMVTRGAQAIRNDRVAVLQRGIWGLGRALAVEHPELWGGLIDVDQDRDLDRTAREICRELLRSDEENEVAWRDGERFVPRLVKWEERPPEAVECRADSSYLVTGGLSGLGLEAA
ncbi:MAG: beta-ketoacyl synthase N-terminal-like domain-containing protein, partial [Acidobacteriota bacterium]